MILVWDNGEMYDDRDTVLLRVPIPNGYAAEAERLRSLHPLFEKLLRRQQTDARILALTDDILCFHKYEPEHVADRIPPSALFKWKRNPEKFGRSESNVVPRDEAWQLGRAFVGLLYQRWVHSRRDDPDLYTPGDRLTFLNAIDAWVRSEPTKEVPQ